MSESYASIGGLIEAFYATISGPAGPRNWARERELFHPRARLMRTGIDEHDRPWVNIMSLTEYIADVTPFLASNDFYEIEVGREVSRFGNVAHVRSVYEAYTAPDGPGSTRVPVLPKAGQGEHGGFRRSRKKPCEIDRRVKKGPGLSRAEPDCSAAVPHRRGVNLIQLLHDGARWWVLSVLWDNERDGVRVPEEWLASS